MTKAISAALLLILGAVNAFCSDYPFTIARIDPRVLGNNITSAGVSHGGIKCSPTYAGTYSCVVVNPTANPAPVIAGYVYVSPLIALDATRGDAITLAKKLKAGTATNAEKDRLLLSLCFLLLSTDQ